MGEPKLRTIKIRRRKGTVSRAEVTRAIKAVMKARGEIPTPMPSTRKKAAATRK